MYSGWHIWQSRKELIRYGYLKDFFGLLILKLLTLQHPDGRLPAEYQIMLDPLQTLALVSANTNKILLGTCIIDMLFHNPVLLSKSFATLDIFSNGRTVAGFGIGWSKDEYQSSNIPFNAKGKRADEYLQVLKKNLGR